MSLLFVSCQAGRAHPVPVSGSASSQGGLSTAKQGEGSTSCARDGVAVATDEPMASEEVSLFERLRKDEWLALFCDGQGVYSINGIGNTEYIIRDDEHFGQMTLDYGGGLLWLERSWAKVDPALFVVNLTAAEPTLVKVTHLSRGVEIQDSGGYVLPMTEGNVPYQIIMNQSPISVVMSSERLVCGPECELPDEAIALGHLAQAQYGVWTSPLPQLKRLTYPASDDISIGTILQLPLGKIDLELRAVAMAGRPGTHVWQLFDVSAKEYISPELGVRSKRKLEETKRIDHLMICEEGRGIVIGQGFFGPDLARLDGGGNTALGVCLTGGILFEDRNVLRYWSSVQGERRVGEG
jgi:hypothetical protein